MTPRHRAHRRTLTRTRRVSIILATLALASIPSIATSAALNLKATTYTTHVVGQCTFTIKSFNPSTSTATGTLVVSSRPRTPSGYGAIKYTQLGCDLVDTGVEISVGHVEIDRNASTAAATKTITFRFGGPYEVCVDDTVLLSDTTVEGNGDCSS